MRILYVITELDRGGAEQALYQVARGVRNAGHAVEVAALFHARGAVGEDLRAEGIAVHDLRGQWLHLGARQKLHGLCRQLQPDLIHSWLSRANVFCRWFTPRRIPLLCSARVREHRSANILVERFSPHRYVRYLCVSTAVAEFATRKLRIAPEKITVIPNGVDFERFRDTRKIHLGDRPAAQKLVGLTVARVVKEKGLDILVEALIQLPRDLDWEWHFAGAETDERLAAELKKRLTDAGVAERAHWHGALAPGRIDALYAMADLFALPSHVEGMPNVVLEAMASGIPTIVSGTDGIADILAAGERGLSIVSMNTPPGWVHAIEKLATDVVYRRGLTAAAVEVAQEFSWRQTVHIHLRIYEDTMTDQV